MKDTLSNILAGGFIGLYLLLVIALIILLICLLIGRIALFRKSGISGWKAIIPIYSDYVMDVQVCGLHWALFVAEALLTFGGLTNLIRFVIWGMRYYNLAKKCHKDPIPATIFGAIFSSIVEMVYGLSSSYEYDSSVKVGNLGFLNNQSN